jgi:hypothetical protein
MLKTSSATVRKTSLNEQNDKKEEREREITNKYKPSNTRIMVQLFHSCKNLFSTL